MMLLRQMVRELGKRPENILVDGGREFQGFDFEVLCAACGIGIMSREGQPRSGGAVERQYGSTNTQLVHNLDGNTKFMKDVRSISRTHNPKTSAKWSFKDIVILVSSYVEAHNEYSAQKGSMSPNNLESYSYKIFGNREYLYHNYSDVFYFLSLPYIRRKTAKVRRGQPFVYDYCEHWHQSFSHISPKGIKLPVKWDPEDDNFTYGYLEGGWKKCVLTKRSRRTSSIDKAIKAEVLREEARVNSIAKQNAYEKISEVNEMVERSLDEMNRLLPLVEGNNQSSEVDDEEEVPTSDFSIFNVPIPNSKPK